MLPDLCLNARMFAAAAECALRQDGDKVGVEDGDDLGDGIRLFSPPSDLGEEELGDDT